MNNQIAIGVDIGGSHITSAAVDLKSLQKIKNTTFSNQVNNKASREDILLEWSKAINQTIESASISGKVSIGFAMPGPFQYKTGLALFEGNDKYENLYNVSIMTELPKYIKGVESCALRFLNDATSFGIGVAAMGKAKNHDKIIALTLGTGFGSCFIKDGIPLVTSEGVPDEGCLWNKPFKEGIGDDYFSTRWCLKRFQELTNKTVYGVKEIAEINDANSKAVFKEFGINMADFLIPFLHDYQPGIIVLGGNISKAHEFFLQDLKDKIEDAGLDIAFEISDLMEDAAIIGSAKLFKSKFWNQVKEDLPNI